MDAMKGAGAGRAAGPPVLPGSCRRQQQEQESRDFNPDQQHINAAPHNIRGVGGRSGGCRSGVLADQEVSEDEECKVLSAGKISVEEDHEPIGSVFSSAGSGVEEQVVIPLPAEEKEELVTPANCSEEERLHGSTLVRFCLAQAIDDANAALRELKKQKETEIDMRHQLLSMQVSMRQMLKNSLDGSLLRGKFENSADIGCGVHAEKYFQRGWNRFFEQQQAGGLARTTDDAEKSVFVDKAAQRDLFFWLHLYRCLVDRCVWFLDYGLDSTQLDANTRLGMGRCLPVRQGTNTRSAPAPFLSLGEELLQYLRDRPMQFVMWLTDEDEAMPFHMRFRDKKCIKTSAAILWRSLSAGRDCGE